MTSNLVGQMFGSYELKDVLGRGGMASVYLGYQASIDRSVAVKVLPGEFLHDPNFSQRFTNEAKLLAKLNHPAILPIYDYGNANGMPYIVMPLMSGGTLADRLRKEGALPLSEIVRVITPIAQALEYASQQGILHRDVKPNNILFDAHNNPFLADFGIAKAMEAQTNLTGTGIIGTPDYMSPEQARGETLDHRSDLYSLAVVAYHALTGQLLFSATTPMGLIFKHVSEMPRAPRELRSDLPEEVNVVLLKALAKYSSERYATTTEFARALAEAVKGLHGSVSAFSPAPVYSTPLGTQSSAPPPTAVSQTHSIPHNPMSSSTPPVMPPPPSGPAFGSSQPNYEPPPAYPLVQDPHHKPGIPTWGWIAGGVGVVALCCICGVATLALGPMLIPATTEVAAATSTPRPTATSRPSTANPTPTRASAVNPTPTRASASNPTPVSPSSLMFEDNFTRDTGDWSLLDGSNARIAVSNRGGLVFDIFRTGWRAWSTLENRIYTNPVVRAVARNTGTAIDPVMGVICGYQDNDNYYFAGVTPDGYYGIFKYRDGQTTSLVNDRREYEFSEDVPLNANSYTIDVSCTEGVVTLMVNETFIGVGLDVISPVSGGQVGLYSSTFDDQPSQVTFDSFRVVGGEASLPVDENALFTDDFSTEDSRWGLLNTANATIAFGDDGLRFDIVREQWRAWTTLEGETFSNVSVRAFVTLLSDLTQVPDPAFGLVCNVVDNQNHYYAGISADGYYGIFKVKGGTVTALTAEANEYRFSEDISIGNSFYTVELTCSDGQLILYADGTEIARASDKDFTEGEAGVYAGSFGNVPAQVVFELFEVLQP